MINVVFSQGIEVKMNMRGWVMHYSHKLLSKAQSYTNGDFHRAQDLIAITTFEFAENYDLNLRNLDECAVDAWMYKALYFNFIDDLRANDLHYNNSFLKNEIFWDIYNGTVEEELDEDLGEKIKLEYQADIVLKYVEANLSETYILVYKEVIVKQTSHQTIANVLGTSAGVVKTMAYRCREKIKKAFAEKK